MRMIAAIAALTLAGCTQEEAVAPVEEGETNTQASGEVLGGTISDDMLPLESLESQSPPAEDIGENTGENTGKGSGEDTGDASAEDTDDESGAASSGASPETDDAPSE